MPSCPWICLQKIIPYDHCLSRHSLRVDLRNMSTYHAYHEKRQLVFFASLFCLPMLLLDCFHDTLLVLPLEAVLWCCHWKQFCGAATESMQFCGAATEGSSVVPPLKAVLWCRHWKQFCGAATESSSVVWCGVVLADVLCWHFGVCTDNVLHPSCVHVRRTSTPMCVFWQQY